VTLRRLAVAALAVLGVGVLCLMGYLAYRQGENLEAAGWLTAGFLALREIISKVENISLGIRQGGDVEE